MLNNVTLVFVGTLVEYVKCLSNILKVLSNVYMIYMCIYIHVYDDCLLYLYTDVVTFFIYVAMLLLFFCFRCNPYCRCY